MRRSKATTQLSKKVSNSIDKKRNKGNFFVTFLGVRGTIPTPAREWLKYGGNTSCVEITSILHDFTTSIYFDAGTGIIRHADNALTKGVRIFHLFLSHMHYDHIIGLSRFMPLFREDCVINIYGQAKRNESLKDIIQNFFKSPFFPIEFDQLPAKKNINFYELNLLKTIKINHVRVDIQPLNHPQGALAYKIWDSSESTFIVYATDHEHGTSVDSSLAKFVQNSSLLIYDSTYTTHEYSSYAGWGHSTAEIGAQMAKDCKVKSYAIFHHDPAHNDQFLENVILPEAKKIFRNSFLSKENETIIIK